MNMELSSVVLSQREFQILASMEDLERFCGFALDTDQILSQEELWLLLLEMFQNGELLITDGEDAGIEIQPVLKRAFEILKSCVSIFVIYPGREDCPTRCFYPSRTGEILLIRNSNINAKELRLSVLTNDQAWESIWESFEDAGCVLQEGEETETYPEETVNRIDEDFPEASCICRLPDVLLVIDRISAATGITEGRCVLTEENIFTWLLLQEGQIQKKRFANRHSVEEFLQGCLGKGEGR